MNDPLRIALISVHASPLASAGSTDAGGQNVCVAQVAQRLAAAGHRVDVLTRRDDPQLPPVVALSRNVQVLHVDAGPARFVAKEALLPHLGAFTDAAQRLFTRSPLYDAVHAHFFLSGVVGLALRQRFHQPLVTSFHALGLVQREHQRETDPSAVERIGIERQLACQSDRVIASCPQEESDLMRLYGAPPDRITNVPHGVDTQALRPGDRLQARQRLGLPADEFIVLQLGRVVARKGIDNLVRALALLRDEALSQPVRAVVVGGGSDEPNEIVTPEIGRLRRLAASLGVGQQLMFAGRKPREQLRDWYLAANVFVTTPWYEPFGITPLEAMACGIPVIGSAVGGVQYTVINGVTGLLVPPHDPAALAASLRELQRHPNQCATMGRAGVRRVREHFTWDLIARRLARVYESVGRPPGTARAPHPALLSPVRLTGAALS